jgi:hypothetical protein
MWEFFGEHAELLMWFSWGILPWMIVIWTIQGVIRGIGNRLSSIGSTLWLEQYRQYPRIREKLDAASKHGRWQRAEDMAFLAELRTQLNETEETWRFSPYW